MLPQLDLRRLAYFVAVAEELHFGRAAARLHIAQPSLSVQIRKLEHALGVTLLLRDSRHVHLTEAGEVLLEESRRLLASADRVAALTRETGHGANRGRFRVGFQANAAAELTPQVLAAFQKMHPSLQVQMQSFDFSDPYVGLAEGAVDVAFVRPPLLVHDWLGIEALFAEPRVLVVATSSPLAGFECISVEQVLKEPFVARNAPEDWRNFWLATDARQGEPVRLGAEVVTVDECFEAILAERGVAFSQASTERFYARPGLAFIPVTDIPATTLSIAWRRDVDSQLTREFVETARVLSAAGGVPDTWSPASGAPTPQTSPASVGSAVGT